MTDRYARLFERGQSRYDSASDAWESITERREHTDWDPDAVRADDRAGVEHRFDVPVDD